MYKSFVEETLMRLKEVTIKYPSAFLQGLGFNMNDITKKEMDNEWRKINGIIILEMADLYAFCQGNTVQNPIPCARPLALLSNIRFWADCLWHTKQIPFTKLFPLFPKIIK
jgi:hypothetical protein